jgi:hypothetical protein
MSGSPRYRTAPRAAAALAKASAASWRSSRFRPARPSAGLLLGGPDRARRDRLHCETFRRRIARRSTLATRASVAPESPSLVRVVSAWLIWRPSFAARLPAVESGSIRDVCKRVNRGDDIIAGRGSTFILSLHLSGIAQTAWLPKLFGAPRRAPRQPEGPPEAL